MNHDSEYYNREIETAPYSELEATQLRAIRKVVRYGYDNTPFYHRRWKRVGVTPEDINSFGDFQRKIPAFTKDDLREELDLNDITGGITSCSAGDVRNYAMTSGTSGINTFIGLGTGYMDEFVENLAMREYWMARMRPGMRVFLVPAGWHFFGMAQNLVLTKMGVSCFSSWGTLFHRFIPSLMSALHSANAQYFLAIPWVMSELISESQRVDVAPQDLFSEIKYVSLAGEPVTAGFRSKILNETGIEDVFESAGSVDGLWGGTDCYAHKGHHVWMDDNFLEVVDLNAEEIQGEERGRMISTNLRLGGPLFIRFLGEDLVSKVREKCECGRTHERVEMYDRLVNTFKIGSKTLTPHDVSMIIEEICGYRIFSIINPDEALEKLKIRIAKGIESEDYTRLTSDLDGLSKKKLGIGLDIEWVDRKMLPFVHRKLVQVVRDKKMAGFTSL